MIILQGILEALIIVLVYSAGFSIFLFCHPRVRRYYRNWKIKKRNQQWEKKHEEFVQQQRKWLLEQKLHKEEKRKYPLFFLKEGIV